MVEKQQLTVAYGKLDVVAAASPASIPMWWIKGVLLRSMQCHVLCVYKKGKYIYWTLFFFGVKVSRITLFRVIYSPLKC